MNPIVLKYLLEEEKMTEKIALQNIRKFNEHPDISEEFAKWVEARQFPEGGAICIEGYTARILSDTTYLHPVGAYNYLIYLRENPVEAVKFLKEGLPRK